MPNFFDDASIAKITKAVRLVLSQGTDLTSGRGQLRDEEYYFRRGKLDESIASESSGTVSLWILVDGSYEDSGDNVEAYNWSNSTYDSGIKVCLICNGAYWEIVSADCNV